MKPTVLIMKKSREEAIFFYDGECGFCNATVMFLLDRTSPNTLLFCQLQSRFTEIFFSEHNYPQPNLTTAYLFHQDRLYQKSSAVLQAVALSNGLVQYVRVFLAVPKFIRDGVYDFVSIFRKQIGIRNKNCRLLTPDERKRFVEI